MAETLNDLQLVDTYIEHCRNFINPKLFREIQKRGLYNIINHLPKNINEAKAIARARLSHIGKEFGDEEINQIANTIQRIEFLITQLNQTPVTDVNTTLPILRELIKHSETVRDYFK